jgi:hypothetical protein
MYQRRRHFTLAAVTVVAAATALMLVDGTAVMAKATPSTQASSARKGEAVLPPAPDLGLPESASPQARTRRQQSRAALSATQREQGMKAFGELVGPKLKQKLTSITAHQATAPSWQDIVAGKAASASRGPQPAFVTGFTPGASGSATAKGLATASVFPTQDADTDADADGLPESFEGQLADAFTPEYHVSGGEEPGTGMALFQDGVPQTVRETRPPTPPISHYRVQPLGFSKASDGSVVSVLRIDYLTLWNRDDGPDSVTCDIDVGLLGGLVGVDLLHMFEGLLAHRLDNERSAVLVAAPTTVPSFNLDPSAYRAYAYFTTAHEGDPVFDQSTFIVPGTPVPANSHILLALSRSKHGTYTFNPDFYPLFPADIIGIVYAEIDLLRATEVIGDVLYLVLNEIADTLFFGCAIERFEEQGGQYAQTRINIGEPLGHAINGSGFIEDDSKDALHLRSKLTGNLFGFAGPARPGPIATLVHGSRVNLRWGASTGATDYQVYRDGVPAGTTSGTQLLDIQVSPKQSYKYAVVARNAYATSPPANTFVRNDFEAADRAYLSTKDGPALCGRVGDATNQALICHINKPTGWVSVGFGAGDWGYTEDRAWLTNADGTISYCRRVGVPGNYIQCNKFDGSGTISTSPFVDVGYPENRAYLSTKDGPALCGRAGFDTDQHLVCTVLKPSGWFSLYSGVTDWGYREDRTWLTNADGTVSYCRRVGVPGNYLQCDRFDGTAWSTSTSGFVDVGYPQDRTFLSSKDGPALCGRVGDVTNQALICHINKPTGWASVGFGAGDWGYSEDRTWLTNADGTISYCRRVGVPGNYIQCNKFDGSGTISTSPFVDVAYPENRTYLSTKDGPALCGRVGDVTNQALACQISTPTGWITVGFGAGDWGYSEDRAFLTNADGTVSYCRRVGVPGNYIQCNKFGASGTISTSAFVDVGYPDTFPG